MEDSIETSGYGTNEEFFYISFVLSALGMENCMEYLMEDCIL